MAPIIRLQRPDRAAASAAESEGDAALVALAAAGLSLPVVAKPGLGCRSAGVKLVRTPADLLAYIDGFPHGAAYLL